MGRTGSDADLVGVGPDCEWRVSGVIGIGPNGKN